MKRHHDQGNSYTGQHLIGDWLTDPEGQSIIIKAESMARFRGLTHCHGGKHGSMQADMMLEETRVLHLDPQAAEGDFLPHQA